MRNFFCQIYVLLLLFVLILSGCKTIDGSQSIVTNPAEQEVLKVRTAEFDGSLATDYIALYQSKLVYAQWEWGADPVYYCIYDFQTGENRKVKTVRNSVIQGKSSIMVDNTLYFYIGVEENSSIKNVLYKVDFSTETMDKVSVNEYKQKLIPLAEHNSQLLALQVDQSADGTIDSFIEVIEDDGSTKRISLIQNYSDFANEICRILYMNCDDEYLYTIEGFDSAKRYFFVKYNSHYDLVEKVEITHLFSDYLITENIAGFYVFGDYFCITDYSMNLMLCKLQESKAEVVLCDSKARFAANCLGNESEARIWRKDSNDMYIINSKTGEIEVSNYEFERGARWVDVLDGEEHVLCVKEKETDAGNIEYLYLMPK